MSDLNWCTYCDNAISQHSSSLYCSQKCLREDALNHHLSGCKYPEFKNSSRIKSAPTKNTDKKPKDDQIFRLETVSTEKYQKDTNYQYFDDDIDIPLL